MTREAANSRSGRGWPVVITNLQCIASSTGHAMAWVRYAFLGLFMICFFLYNCPLKYFLCMFLFALLDKFAVRVLINKCSPLTYIIFWLFSCACFNWHRAYRSFDGLVLLARQQQQHRCFLESILIVVAELSVSPPCYHINADLLLIGLPTATLCLVFFFWVC